MGLVAWTSQPTGPAASAEQSPSSQISSPSPVKQPDSNQYAPPHTGHEQASDVSSEPDTTSLSSGSLPEIALWLAGQAPKPFTYRGSQTLCSGVDSSALLVVSLQTSGSDELELPMSQESMRLLDLMLRAIDTRVTDTRQCVVQSTSTPAASSAQSTGISEPPASLASLITPSVRAVLLLDSSLSDLTRNNGDSVARLPESFTPLIRIPHPSCLLQNPALKRAAWEGLKQLKILL